MAKNTFSKFVTAISFLAFTFSASSNAESWFDFSGIVAPAIGVDNLPYKNSNSDPYGSLLIMGRSGDLFFEGNRLGYLIGRTGLGAISLMGQVRSHQYLIEEDNKKAVEAGLQLSTRLGGGWFSQMTLFTDVSDNHGGQELELGAFRRDRFGDLSLLTLLALQQQSKALTGHFANGLDYNVQSGDLNAEIEFIGTYTLTENLRLVGVYRHYFHNEGIDNSPLTENAQTQRFLIGLGWAF